MKQSIGETLREQAVELVKNSPQGIRLTDLKKKLQSMFPEVKYNTLRSSVWDLEVTRPNEIAKPYRGVFMYTSGTTQHMVDIIAANETVETPINGKNYSEETFYEPFANWLTKELGECTDATSLGGSLFGNKWGTPDVIGVYKPDPKDIIKFHPEIITAEIKINSNDPITAFGQAMAYRLFSSKVYLVLPDTLNPIDFDRIEALCNLSGIGLIIFKLNPENPDFAIRLRGQKHLPDLYFVNQMLDTLKERRNDIFKRLL